MLKISCHTSSDNEVLAEKGTMSLGSLRHWQSSLCLSYLSRIEKNLCQKWNYK